MIGVYELRINVAFMSCAHETKALRMISVVIGSAAAGAGRSAVCAMSLSSRSLVSRDHDVAALVERGVAPRRDDGRRARLLDHDRAVVAASGGKAIAQQDRRLVLLAGEHDGPRAEPWILAPGRRRVRLDRARDAAHRGEAEVHELDR